MVKMTSYCSNQEPCNLTRNKELSLDVTPSQCILAKHTCCFLSNLGEVLLWLFYLRVYYFISYQYSDHLGVGPISPTPAK